jgi:ankyrin repeat protein
MTRLTVALALLPLAWARPAAAADPGEELWAAARKGDAPAVEALLARGADVNAKTHYGATAFWFAAYKGHAPVVTLLLRHQADPSVRDTVWGETPLTLALTAGDAAMVSALMQARAKDTDAALLTAVGRGRLPLVRAVLDQGKVRPATLTTALAVVPADSAEVTELLRKAGAQPAPDVRTPEQRAAQAAAVGDYEETRTGAKLQLAEKDGLLVARFSGAVYVLKPGSRIWASSTPGRSTTPTCSGAPPAHR